MTQSEEEESEMVFVPTAAEKSELAIHSKNMGHNYKNEATPEMEREIDKMTDALVENLNKSVSESSNFSPNAAADQNDADSSHPSDA